MTVTEFRATVVLTRRAFEQYCVPLLELGIASFEQARDNGLMTDIEYRFMARQLGDRVPSMGHFEGIQDAKFDEIKSYTF